MNTNADDPNRDADVSRHYKSLARERVPDELDRKILAQATDNVKKGADRGLFDLWTKPLAWAATIGLSLAIVLQLSESPIEPHATYETSVDALTATPRSDAAEAKRSTDAPATTAPKAERRSVREDFTPQTLETIEEAEQQMLLRSGPNRREIELQDVTINKESSAGASRTAAQLQENAFSAGLGEADAVDAPAGASDADVVAEPAARLALQAVQADADPVCDETSRAKRITWMSCIETLRRQGDAESADREYEALLAKFPADPADQKIP